MKTKSEKCKITVQLWDPLLERLNQMTSDACLNRDAYLNVVLANETAMLVTELQGKKNSDAARGFVRRCLLELKDLTPVSLNLTRETADALKHACDSVNVWRDVFVNRVICHLVAKSSLFENQWGFKFADHRRAIFEEGSEIRELFLGSPLAAIRGLVTDDPFLGIRAALRAAYPEEGGAIYPLSLGSPLEETRKERGLVGLSTYLEDSAVPGTSQNYETSKWSDALLESLGDDSDSQKRTRK